MQEGDENRQVQMRFLRSVLQEAVVQTYKSAVGYKSAVTYTNVECRKNK